jgi:hypothetical protein
LSLLQGKFVKKEEAGKKTVVKESLETLLSVMSSHTAGNPMDCNTLWTNLTFKQIQEKLKEQLISVSCPVIKKMLKSCHFVKRKMRKCKTFKEVENRDKQFEYISKTNKHLIDNNLPALSIDTKKKELTGDFFSSRKSSPQRGT